MKHKKPYCVEYTIQEKYTFISEPDFWDTRRVPITSTRSKIKRKYFNNLKDAKQFKKECYSAVLLTYKLGYLP